MGSEWNPWAELRRRGHLRFGLVDLPAGVDGVYWPYDDGDGAAILIDRDLPQAERRAVLAHELVHDERGGGMVSARDMPVSLRAVVARHESSVDNEVSRRLVPLYELEVLIARLSDLGEPVHAVTVAEEFEVPLDVAQRALTMLDRERRAS